MKLVSEIINELVDAEKPLTSALLKTKVLASRLQNEKLLGWVSNELKGYGENDTLPDYRKYKANILGTYLNGGMEYYNQPVPTNGLDKDLENLINSMNFNQSISNLENLKKENKSGKLEYTFPAELTGLIQLNWQKYGNPYLQLINCKKVVSVSAVVEIVSVVRNNLLDFMLRIDSEFGNITEISELITKQNQITNIMSQTIINTNGDGNIINTGDKVKITADINVSKGNKEELKKHLQEIGLNTVDSDELIEIIDTEKPNQKNKTFGKKVNDWTQKMLGKALDGSWNISIGAAGTLLAEAIKKYYGM